jgi:hypothetical protein
LPQVLIALDQEIVSAQMRRIVPHELGGDGFAVEPLLQNIEALDASVPHHQKLAVDCSANPQRLQQVGKAPRNVLAGAGVKTRDASAVRIEGRHRLHPNPVPFPFGDEICRIESAHVRVLQRMGEHRRAEWRRIVARGLAGAPLEPGEQVEIGRAQAGPHQLDLRRLLVAERRRRGLCQTRRDPNTQFSRDQLEERPAPGLIERIEPVRKRGGQRGLAQRGKRSDNFAQARRRALL